MNRLVLLVIGSCFFFVACSQDNGNGSPGDAAAPMADSAQSGGSVGSIGGSMATGGATGATGGASASAGTSAGGGTSATGGISAAGGASATGGRAGANGQGGGTNSKIDYSIWSLQLPIGSGTSPTTVSGTKLSTFSNEYFYLAADGGQIFMDPATGITTPNSAHCRTEMHELAPGGGGAAWTYTGINTMTVSGMVLQVGGGAGGHVTVGQVFNGTDNVPLCELEYSASQSGFVLLYEEAKGAGTNIDLKTPVALNTRYDFTLALSQGVLTVSINGQDVYTKTPSAGIAAKTFYFKAGNYDQTAAAGDISVVPYTVVEVYSVDVVHK